MPAVAALPSELIAVVTQVVAGFGPSLGVSSSADLPNALRQDTVARLALATGYRYAPGAPLEVAVEAATRHGGYMLGVPAHVSRRSLADPTGTTVEVEYLNSGASNGFRRSGARALLSMYRVRRVA